MYVATINDNSLKNSLKVSAGLHIMLFLLLFFGLPHLMPPLPEHHDPVPFEIVTVADITNTRIKDDSEPQKQPAPPPKPEPQKPAPAPPQPAPQPTPQPPAPAKPEEPKPVEKAEALKPLEKEKPKPVEKPQPQPDLLANVLKDVAKMKPAEQVKTPDDKADVKTPVPPAAAQAPSLSNRLTISENDALIRQIEQYCFNPPIGAKDADQMVTEIIIDVNPDRTVSDVEIVDKMRYASDSFYRALTDAAVRAVRNPKCSPLALPPDKYDQWKRIDANFSASGML